MNLELANRDEVQLVLDLDLSFYDDYAEVTGWTADSVIVNCSHAKMTREISEAIDACLKRNDADVQEQALRDETERRNEAQMARADARREDALIDVQEAHNRISDAFAKANI
jgi:hypothetical protein